MENKTKRFLSLLLALVMVIGLMPVGHAHAEEDVALTMEATSELVAGDRYVICLAGTTNALSNQTGSGAWGTHTLATVATTMPSDSTIWTLEEAEGGYLLKNASGYLTHARNAASVAETGDVYTFEHTEGAGWAIKNTGNNEYLNNLGDSGSIGGWSGDGTKFDLYKVVETDWSVVDPYGKRNWTEVSVDTETVYDAKEGQFEYAWDNTPGTIWHSNWQGAQDKLTGENSFTGIINFNEVYTINTFSFTPRVGNNSGIVTQATIAVKASEDAEWVVVAPGKTFENNGDTKTVCFKEQEVQFVKFTAEASSDGWVAVSEFDIALDEDAHTPLISPEGYCTDSILCEECGAVIEEGAEAHMPEQDDGDCTTEVLCQLCPAVVIPAAEDHTYEDDGDCTTAVNCTVCGTEVTPAAEAHTYEDDGNCTTAVNCTVCGTEVTPAAEAHTYDDEYDADCNVCGTTREVEEKPEDTTPVVTEPEFEPEYTSEAITGITGEASSVDTSEPAHNKDVANAFDGDPSTFWATQGVNVADCWLIIDLGSEQLINRVDYTMRHDSTWNYACTGNLANYIIEVSSDKSTWTPVTSGDTVGTDNCNQAYLKDSLEDGTFEITFEETSARYIRLTTTKSYIWNGTATSGMTAAEIAVYKAVCVEHTFDADCKTADTCKYCDAVAETAEHTPDEDDHDCTTAEVCAVCGTEITPATEHAMDDGVYTEGEGEELGYTTYSCTNEGCDYEDVVYDEPDPTPDETDPEPTDPEPTVPVEIDFNATKVNWTGEADSQTIWNEREGLFTYAWDGNTNTIWHTDWQGANKGVLTGENTFTGEINFGEAYNINQFSFLPRQDDTQWENGSCVILQASLFVKASEDAEWVCVADQVVFPHNQQQKTFYFTQQEVQFVKLVCERASQMGMTDGNGPQGYVAVAEFYIEDNAASDLTITATNDGNGTITGVPEAPVAIGSSVTLTAVPAEGRTFEGWYNALGTKVSTDAEYTFPAATNISLTAKFIDNTYTVTFDHGYNEQTTTRTVTHGNTVRLPSVTRDGFDFGGWFDAEGNEFTADTAVTGDITVTAKWTEAVVEPTVPEVTDPTDPSEPDASEPDASEPDASEPDASEPDASEPDASEPDASEPDASEPDASEPDASEPDASEPEYTVPECDKDDNCVLSQFDDIVATEWYHDGIHFCVEEGIMNGMGEGKFAPTENTTRAQLVMMLYRLAGTPSMEGETEPFTDVADTDWFYAPIVWAYKNKVVNGVSETEFAPNANVTREQVATILYRYLGEPEGTGKLDAFPDVADVSEYAVAPLTWAVGEGLITGIAQADGTALLAPTGNATRAQIATILMRHLTK